MMIVLDANVLVSAFISDRGAPAEIRGLWEAEKLEVVVSQAIVTELERVLHYPHLQNIYHYSDAEIAQFVALIQETCHWVRPEVTVHVVQDDPSDNRYLECAQAAAARVIVSGDKHLLRLKRYEEIEILSPREFLTYFAIN